MRACLRAAQQLSNPSAAQVDVRALKGVLWDALQRMHADPSPVLHSEPSVQQPPEQSLSFQDLVATLSPTNPAGHLDDISVHLCFICLLHLANEHGLRVTGAPTLDTLLISCLGDET